MEKKCSTCKYFINGYCEQPIPEWVATMNFNADFPLDLKDTSVYTDEGRDCECYVKKEKS